ncbi:hypothetical protein COE67_19835 [Priestia megaterium]|uniref:hypothetical protein n=1 Tax=Priestia megaterium TaxID=1404 RepID=UPI000BFD0737|nr:hypothetical protein [Priestia megaterium]PGX34580.1 hypothetical protein COE67_19835 [Priestia megaterium]
MKKNFLSEIKVENSLYVYNEYSLEQDSSFLEEKVTFFLYDGYAPTKVIPPSLPLKDSFFNAPLYGEIEKGEVEKIDPESKNNKQKEYKETAAYLVSQKAVTTWDSENMLEHYFPSEQITKKYDLSNFGKTLYTELAKWNFSSFQELVTFCDIWGLPTGVNASEFSVTVNDVNVLWMPLDEFYRKFDDYQKIFSIFKSLHTNDFSELTISPSNSRKSMRENARLKLIEKIGEKNIFSYKLTTNNNIVTPTSMFKDLFEAAFFFLTLSIYSNAEMRICENCGHLYEVTHKRQRFCSVLPGRKRSSCEMAYNNRLKKEKKLKQKGNK